jgi:spore germination protein KB
MGIAGEAKNDAWISGLLGLAMSVPVILLYSRIVSLFPGKDIFEILGLVLGKVAGSFVSILYIWYALHLGALVIRNFGEFMNVMALPETPILVPMLCIGLVCVCAVSAGVEVMGRLSSYFFPVILVILLLVQILGIPKLELHFLKPMLGSGINTVLQSGFSTFAFPFAETVLFIGVFFSLKSRKSPYKVYLWGTLLAGLIVVIIAIRNITVLGKMHESFYFPSYEVVSRISSH